MNRIEAMKLLSEIKHYLTAGNPVWDVDEIAEACDMVIEAIKNEINCVKCEHYTERETYTGIKGVCKMDTAHRGDLIRRSDAIALVDRPVVPTGDGDYDNARDWERESIKNDLLSLPSADAIEVVRCKDCYHAEDDITHMFCVYFHHKVYEDDYCSNAVERREDGEA